MKLWGHFPTIKTQYFQSSMDFCQLFFLKLPIHWCFFFLVLVKTCHLHFSVSCPRTQGQGLLRPDLNPLDSLPSDSPLSSRIFIASHICLPEIQNMDSTKVTTVYFSGARLQISPPCQYLSAAMHRAASTWCMLWPKWCFPPKKSRIRPYPSDTPQRAISM